MEIGFKIYANVAANKYAKESSLTCLYGRTVKRLDILYHLDTFYVTCIKVDVYYSLIYRVSFDWMITPTEHSENTRKNNG